MAELNFLRILDAWIYFSLWIYVTFQHIYLKGLCAYSIALKLSGEDNYLPSSLAGWGVGAAVLIYSSLESCSLWPDNNEQNESVNHLINFNVRLLDLALRQAATAEQYKS